MGYRGYPLGKYLLGGDYDEDYVVDIRFLHDDCRGGPWGFDPRTQKRVRAIAGYDSTLSQVLGDILMQPLVIVACNAGHHRSVVMTIDAESRIRQLQSPTIELEVVHVDAGNCTIPQWERLNKFFERLPDDRW